MMSCLPHFPWKVFHVPPPNVRSSGGAARACDTEGLALTFWPARRQTPDSQKEEFAFHAF